MARDTAAVKRVQVRLRKEIEKKSHITNRKQKSWVFFLAEILQH